MDTILLSPDDNVVVLARSTHGGETLVIEDKSVTLAEPLGLGHKLARRAIRRGEKIIKYGAPIGSATQDISAGDHVHLHNIQSDYLPTFTLEEGKEFHQPA